MYAESRRGVAEVVRVSGEGRLDVDLFEFSHRLVQQDAPVEHLRNQ